MAKERSKAGQPSKFNPNFHPDDFIKLSKQGKSKLQIARDWGVHRETIDNWAKQCPKFFDTVRAGTEWSEAWHEDIAQQAMIGKLRINGESIDLNVRLFELVTRNRFGWSKDSRVEISGRDGKPLQINTFVDLIKDLEREESENE